MPASKRPAMLLLLLSCCVMAQGQVRLASLFSDSMVLQRNKPFSFFGEAAKGEKISVSFAGKKRTAVADANGRWRVVFPATSAGGPYDVVVNGSNKQVLRQVLVGDVWFCSGQSNMVWKVGWLAKERDSLHWFNNPLVRVLMAPNNMQAAPAADVQGLSWKAFTPENAAAFSAVAAHFARLLQPEAGVPIGIIVSAWGGTDIEPWMSATGLRQFEKHLPALQRLQAVGNMDAYLQHWTAAQQRWSDSLQLYDPGFAGGWAGAVGNDTGWTSMHLPGVWDTLGFVGEGSGWFRRSFALTTADTSGAVLLSFGKVNNSAEVFVNGQRLPPPRPLRGLQVYAVPASSLRVGTNTVVARVVKLWGRGGFTGPAEDMFITAASGTRPLAGPWQFRPGFVGQSPSTHTSPNTYPASLFNGMVHPFSQLPVAGVLWYQGENNTSRPEDYAAHLQALIKDWRQHWNVADLPFLVVQLPNFAHDEAGRVGNFNRIRQAQQEAAALPGVAVAVTLDLGDSTDIHPVNKYAVGYRLALLARKMVYGQDSLLVLGPTLVDATRKDAELHLQFAQTGAGLITPDRYGYVKGFEVAGADGVFHYAQATITANRVVVHSPKVPLPVQVRYAWADNPELGLFNSAGLPAASFLYVVK